MAIWYIEPCPDFVVPTPKLPEGFDLPEDFKATEKSFKDFVLDTLLARHILRPRYLECKESLEKQVAEMEEHGYLALDGTDREYLLLVCADPEFQQPDDSPSGWRWCKNWPYPPLWCAKYVGPCIKQIKAASKTKPGKVPPAPEPDPSKPAAPAAAVAVPDIKAEPETPVPSVVPAAQASA